MKILGIILIGIGIILTIVRNAPPKFVCSNFCWNNFYINGLSFENKSLMKRV